jgi:hypothetical protein
MERDIEATNGTRHQQLRLGANWDSEEEGGEEFILRKRHFYHLGVIPSLLSLKQQVTKHEPISQGTIACAAKVVGRLSTQVELIPRCLFASAIRSPVELRPGWPLASIPSSTTQRRSERWQLQQ